MQKLQRSKWILSGVVLACLVAGLAIILTNTTPSKTAIAVAEGWERYAHGNEAFTLQFAYPERYVVTGPHGSADNMLELYKEETVPDATTLEDEWSRGFSGGTILVRWFPGERSTNEILGDTVKESQGVETTHAGIIGKEFTRVGYGGISAFIFQSAGYTFAFIEPNPTRLGDFPQADWQGILNSIEVTKE